MHTQMAETLGYRCQYYYRDAIGCLLDRAVEVAAGSRCGLLFRPMESHEDDDWPAYCSDRWTSTV
jgi:hypothetical protein